MKVGLFAPLRSPVCTAELLTDLGRGAEAAGLASLWMGEHVVMCKLHAEVAFPVTVEVIEE